jgi:hypothetical protein
MTLARQSYSPPVDYAKVEGLPLASPFQLQKRPLLRKNRKSDESITKYFGQSKSSKKSKDKAEKMDVDTD